MVLATPSHKAAPNDEPRDRPFDPWRLPATPKARELVGEAARLVEYYELQLKPRKRRRKEAGQRTFEATVSAIMCDLVHHHLSDEAGAIAITRDKRKLARRSRYRPPALGSQLPAVLDVMASPDLGLVTQTLGTRRERKQTTI